MRLMLKVHQSFNYSQKCGFTGEMDFEEGTSVLQLIENLGIPPHTCFILLNGKLGALDNILKDEDSIAVYPVIIGG